MGWMRIQTRGAHPNSSKLKATMNRKLLLAFCSAILTILIAGAFAYRSLVISSETEQWVGHTHDVLSKLEDCLLSVESFGSSFPSYKLTGNIAAHSSFEEQATQKRQNENAVRELTTDNPPQQRRINELQHLSEDEIQFDESVIAARQKDGQNAATAMVQTGRGRQIRQAIHGKVRELQSEELRLRAIRSERVKRSLHFAYAALLVSVFLGFSIATGAAWSLDRESMRRLQAEKTAKAGEENFRCLLDATPDSMVVLRPDGTILLLNQRFEAQFGYTRDDLLGGSVNTFFSEGLADRLTAAGIGARSESLADHAGTVFELQVRRKNGSFFPAEIMLSNLKTEDGPLLIAAVRDITERRNSERQVLRVTEELKRSNTELQQFAYVASHDLQEPLRMISSYMQLLGKRYKGRLDSDADEFIAFALDGCSRMKGLILDLLAYSRAGGQKAPLRHTSCQDALDAALANLSGALEDNGAIVTHDSLPSIIADHTQICRVLQNLIGNALKYRSAETPRIHISAARDENKNWVFSVQDNGIGIEPRYFERIFLLFQRLHGPGEVGGSGIGLSICQKNIGRMGGRIWVASELGLGSTFYFSLPENPPAEIFSMLEGASVALPVAE